MSTGIYNDIESVREDIKALEDQLHQLNGCCKHKAHITDLRRIRELVETISSKRLHLEVLERVMCKFIPA